MNEHAVALLAILVYLGVNALYCLFVALVACKGNYEEREQTNHSIQYGTFRV